MAAALALSALVVAGPAAAGSQPNGYRDAHERGTAATSGEAAIAFFVANERSTLAQPPGEAAIRYFNESERATLAQQSGEASIRYFNENERATMAESAPSGALVGYVDSPERGAPHVGTTLISQGTVDGGSEFDWSAAVVGASSALILVLLIGVSLVVARNTRGRPLAR